MIPGQAQQFFTGAAGNQSAPEPPDPGFKIERSLRFNAADSAYLSYSPSSLANQRVMTFSFWYKPSDISNSADLMLFGQDYNTSGNAVTERSMSIVSYAGKIGIYDYGASTDSGNSGSSDPWTPGYIDTTAIFRDASAWYHFVIAIDTTQSTSTNRCKVYVNGVQRETSSQPNQNSYLSWGQVRNKYIGGQFVNGGYTRSQSGYMAEIHFIDGTQYAASDFGEFETDNGTNEWRPKAFSGTYGSEGFYLKFEDNSSVSALGTDSSGNGNNFTPNNFSVSAGTGNDSLIDTPTKFIASSGNNVGNYATFNPLTPVGRDCTFSNGNLDVVIGTGYGGTSNDGIRAVSTIGMSSGKFYFEHQITGGTLARSNVGVLEDITNVGYGGNHWIGSRSTDYIVWSNNGDAINSGSSTSYGVSWSSGDIIGCAFDADNGNLYVYKNGTIMNSGTPAFTGLTNGPYYFVAAERQSNISVNFGQRSFSYSVPAGYKTLCAENIATPSIFKGKDSVDQKIYTGNGSSQTLTGLAFGPDLVWCKARSFGADPEIYDIVRGAGKRLYTSLSNAESSPASSVNSFTSDGFSVTGGGGVNNNTSTYVGWTWDAGTSTVSNTDGSITSNVRANPSVGFSIVSYTGTFAAATIGHGLNAAPEMIIVKNLDTTNDWNVYHVGTDASSPGQYHLRLNSDVARQGGSGKWNNTSPTSTVFSVADSNTTNGSGNDMIAYCFAPVAGYSAFGTYTGNADNFGPFIETGFAPQWVMTKSYDGGSNDWTIWDNTRNETNERSQTLFPNLSASEDTGFYDMDFFSNGFKLKHSGSKANGSGWNYIYAAFSDQPFKIARGR